MSKYLQAKNHFLSSGSIGVFIILAVIVIGSILLSGGLSFKVGKQSQQPETVVSGGFCCDSGDGDACRTSDTQKFIWKGDEYALIKSGIGLSEGSGHLAPASPPDDKDPEGNRIFINTTNTDPNHPECKPNGEDAVFKGGQCIGIPNDIIIYVCKSNCEGRFGTGKFDAYLRLRDGIIPDVIKNCTKPEGTSGGTGEQEIVISSEAGKTNLQLQTFKVIEKNIVASWLSPYCKPAIYLYPKQTLLVNVRIDSPTRLTYTDPIYSINGWTILAEPNGSIFSGNKYYEYLYYETEVPDEQISKPKEGFVVERDQLEQLFKSILPKLGLNILESKEFSDYWLKVLPDSRFYFVGVMAQRNLDNIAKLSIAPEPQTVIRVTLYFEPLNERINVREPLIITPQRIGFTVVEWGGIFKTDKNRNFSCLM